MAQLRRRTVYEAALPSSGIALVRGSPEGKIGIGRNCLAQFAKQHASCHVSGNADRIAIAIGYERL
jgi:hypothetical protein